MTANPRGNVFHVDPAVAGGGRRPASGLGARADEVNGL